MASNCVSSTIPGMTSCKQIKDNCFVSYLEPLEADDLTKINKIYQENVFFEKSFKN